MTPTTIEQVYAMVKVLCDSINKAMKAADEGWPYGAWYVGTHPDLKLAIDIENDLYRAGFYLKDCDPSMDYRLCKLIRHDPRSMKVPRDHIHIGGAI